MRLSELFGGLSYVQAGQWSDIEATGVSYDSRTARPGDLFFCIPGRTSDGHAHAAEALANGAVALVVERTLSAAVPQVRVERVRPVMGEAAARFFGYPSSELNLVGVTGTNGKTTTCHFLRSIFETAGLTAGILGTLGYSIAGDEHSLSHTTPEAPELQQILREMVKAGVQAAAMEVSSHALDLGRVEGTSFRAAVFTNLSPEHLDFHADMEDYFTAKRRLVSLAHENRLGDFPAVVVNVDDDYGKRIAAEVHPHLVTFGLTEEARITGRASRLDPTGTDLEVNDRETGSRFTARLRLIGPFNVYNALAAAACALSLAEAGGAMLTPEVVAAGLEALSRVPGRFERIPGPGFELIIDYAHTPDGLEKALTAARALARGRVIVVFGCGGDRDRLKRPLMGEIATELAEHSVITSDNPRSEDPLKIIREIEAGVRIGSSYEVESDRRRAIARAIAAAAEGDIVVIAGKGHEDYQILDDKVISFEDGKVVQELLAEYKARVEA